MDREAWWVYGVHGVAKGWTRLKRLNHITTSLILQFQFGSFSNMLGHLEDSFLLACRFFQASLLFI